MDWLTPTTHVATFGAGILATIAADWPYYQEDIGIFAIDTIDLIGGSLPHRQRRLVEAWAEIHQAELLTAWERLQARRPPGKIEPLR